MRYAGEYWDETTGLQYLRARWYDPGTARFMGEDTYEGEMDNPFTFDYVIYDATGAEHSRRAGATQAIIDLTMAWNEKLLQIGALTHSPRPKEVRMAELQRIQDYGKRLWHG